MDDKSAKEAAGAAQLYRRAMELTANAAEWAFLEQRLAEVGRAAGAEPAQLRTAGSAVTAPRPRPGLPRRALARVLPAFRAPVAAQPVVVTSSP